MKKLTNAEYEILELFWKQKREINTAEVIELVHNGGSKITRNTIGSFLFKMSKKGVLKSRREGRTYYYTCVDKLEYDKFIINEKLKNCFGVNIEGLILNYCGKKSNAKNLKLATKMLEEFKNS